MECGKFSYRNYLVVILFSYFFGGGVGWGGVAFEGVVCLLVCLFQFLKVQIVIYYVNVLFILKKHKTLPFYTA